MSQFRIQREVLVFFCVFARGKNLLRKGSFPLALFFFQTFSSGRGRGGRSGGVWGWIKKKTFSWVARYCKEEKVRKKKEKVRKKNPGVELLSRTLLCSTIVARPLIDRVRDGNVSFKPAMNTGKKYEMKKGIGGGSVTGVQLSS